MDPVRQQLTTDAVTRRYRLHAGAVLTLIAWWGIGNLYEAIVEVHRRGAPTNPLQWFTVAGPRRRAR